MKKKFFVLFAVLLSMTLQAAAPWDGTTIATAYAGGTGTLADPYQISSPEELAYLGSLVNGGANQFGKYFILTSDLDLNSKSWTPIGNPSQFRGSFDGNSHLISNLNVNLPSTSGVGLFGNVQYAIIKNFGIVGTSTVTGAGNVGAIVGQFVGYGPIVYGISGCFSNATVSGVSLTGNNVGGIVGSFRSTGNDVSSLINNCYSTGNISGTSTSGNNYVSGIVGRVEIATGVTGTMLTISNSYSTGTKTATGGTSNFANGIAKFVTGVPLNVANSYYINGTGVTGAQAVTADDMKTPDFLTALNLSGAASIWKADFDGGNSVNNGFPILAWRNLSTGVKNVLVSNCRVTVIGKTVKIEAPVSIKDMELYNFSGQLVETQHINYAANNVSFDVQHAGIYLLIAHTAEGQQTQKIIVN